MKVLVTGGNGFIGGYVQEALIARGDIPVLFDRHASDWRAADHVEGFFGDIRDDWAVHEAMGKVDGWIHLAGILGTQETLDHPRPAAETNIIGGLNVLAAAAAYGVPGVNIAVGNYWFDNTYSISKHTVERFCEMYRKEKKVPVSTVRAFNAYGPRQVPAAPYGPSRVRKIIPSFVCRALSGEPIEVYGDGSQVMDMVHVRDVAGVLVAVLHDTVANAFGWESIQAVVEAGTGRWTTVKEIAGMVARNVRSRGGRVVSVDFVPMRPGESEGEKVVAAAPWPWDYTPLEVGIDETVAYYVDYLASR